MGRDITPEKLEFLFQKIAANGPQIEFHKLGQLGVLFFSQVLRSFEQKPAALRQHRFETLFLQFSCFLGAYFINCLTHVRHDVESIQNMESSPRFLGNHLQIGALQKNVWVDSCSMVAGFRVDSPWISLRERVEALWKNLRFSHRSPTLIHRLTTLHRVKRVGQRRLFITRLLFKNRILR
uniref:Uncharacterized protein n=1 Tax=Candidatus Kentrum sp. SD TaxID=2126332 RepID=A0A450Z728_9GAMM|nr:MAG: hypothetical protein BECKSD772F_GA0070984_11892 [Candidatus Kentron sp. SD]VFK49595.1 MAG: hypothetical protein BECKSD772E_GA0070983_11972 [Candidatus Kentron sp. SD]